MKNLNNIQFIMIILLVLPWIKNAKAQQDLILTKYSFSSLFINPANAGSSGEDAGSLILNYRNQWLGFDGAPKTILAGGEVNLFDDRVGLGLTLGSEEIGINVRTDILTNYAYRIRLDDAYVVGGIRFGYHLYESRLSELTNFDDPLYGSDNVSFNAISIGAGLYYERPGFYVGLAVPSITTISSEHSNFKNRHVYLHTGAIIYTGDDSDIQIEPLILLKYDFAAPIQVTLGANLWLNESFAIGVHYRSEDAFALSMEFLIMDQLSIGAAYDFTTSELNQHSSGTVELLLGYRFAYGGYGIPMGGKKRSFR